MVNVEAKLRIKGKSFEILVDLDKALQLKKGLPISIENVLGVDSVFSDVKKGLKVSNAELETFFGTSDAKEVAKKIIAQGDIQIPAEYKKKEKEEKIKQVIDFLSKNAIDPQTGRPHTLKRIEDAIKQSGVNIENKPIEQQISSIVQELAKVIPIRIEVKKLRVRVPAIHTGKVYGLVKEYKEKEEWLSNGDLSCVINLPAGLQMTFYDKLNAVTHGSALVEEVKKLDGR